MLNPGIDKFGDLPLVLLIHFFGGLSLRNLNVLTLEGVAGANVFSSHAQLSVVLRRAASRQVGDVREVVWLA